MLAGASARFHVARERMTVAVAWNTTGEGTAEGGLPTIAERAILAALPVVTLRAWRTRFDIADGKEARRRCRMSESDLAEETNGIVHTVRGMDTNSGDIREKPHEVQKGQRWRPRLFVQSERRETQF